MLSYSASFPGLFFQSAILWLNFTTSASFFFDWVLYSVTLASYVAPSELYFFNTTSYLSQFASIVLPEAVSAIVRSCSFPKIKSIMISLSESAWYSNKFTLIAFSQIFSACCAIFRASDFGTLNRESMSLIEYMRGALQFFLSKPKPYILFSSLSVPFGSSCVVRKTANKKASTMNVRRSFFNTDVIFTVLWT